jgi:hypothetical protein
MNGRRVAIGRRFAGSNGIPAEPGAGDVCVRDRIRLAVWASHSSAITDHPLLYSGQRGHRHGTFRVYDD